MIHCNSEFRAYALIRQILTQSCSKSCVFSFSNPILYTVRSTQMCIEHSLAVTTTSHLIIRYTVYVFKCERMQVCISKFSVHFLL